MLSRVACTQVTGRVVREKNVKDIFSLTPQAWAPINLLPLCGTLAATKVVQPWALSSRWPSLWAEGGGRLPDESSPGSHIQGSSASSQALRGPCTHRPVHTGHGASGKEAGHSTGHVDVVT